MACEPDTAQIVDLAFVPFGCGPQRGNGRHFGNRAWLVVLPARQDDLQREAMTVRETLKMVDNFNMRIVAGLGYFLRVRLQIIDAADAAQDLELEIGIVAQVTADFE